MERIAASVVVMIAFGSTVASAQKVEHVWGRLSAISPDGERIVHIWQLPDGRVELRIASLEESGVPTVRSVRQFEVGEFVSPLGWCPDRFWIAVRIERAHHSGRIALLSVQNGTLRPVATSDWQGLCRLRERGRQ
jgi:hypothetical protein